MIAQSRMAKESPLAGPFTRQQAVHTALTAESKKGGAVTVKLLDYPRISDLKDIPSAVPYLKTLAPEQALHYNLLADFLPTGKKSAGTGEAGKQETDNKKESIIM